MRYTQEQVIDLLNNHFPRHIRDVFVATFETDRVPDARVLLIFDQVLLDGNPLYGDPITSAHSLNMDVARVLHAQLSAVIDEVDGQEL